MVKCPRPTRAEVSDVASAIYERVEDGVMLSDETAMGDFPVESVETMARIAREIERDETHFKPMIDMDMVSVNHEITAQLARSAVRASTNLPIKYVVLDTKTGRTGRYLAAVRGRKTVDGRLLSAPCPAHSGPVVRRGADPPQPGASRTAIAFPGRCAGVHRPV